VSVIPIALAAALTATAAAAAPARTVAIPVIGCPTGGMEQAPAPPDTTKSVPLDARLAPRLALYGADDVPGPRGWHCQRYATDTGYVTYVAPEPIADPDAIRGPAILSLNLGSEAGAMYAVAELMARYMPSRWGLARRMAAGNEDMFPGGLVFHPYRGDRFIFRKGDLFEVETPPHARGMGTRWFLPGALPVRSRLRYTDASGFVIVQARLPPPLADLLPAVLARPNP
jgi:hypothetical protein